MVQFPSRLTTQPLTHSPHASRLTCFMRGDVITRARALYSAVRKNKQRDKWFGSVCLHAYFDPIVSFGIHSHLHSVDWNNKGSTFWFSNCLYGWAQTDVHWNSCCEETVNDLDHILRICYKETGYFADKATDILLPWCQSWYRKVICKWFRWYEIGERVHKLFLPVTNCFRRCFYCCLHP